MKIAKVKNSLAICLIALVFSAFITHGQKDHRPILVDGKIESLEWRGSQTISLNPKSELLLKDDDQYYYLAIKCDLPKPFYVDLFVSKNDSTMNFHASSQLGDRVLPPDSDWTDEIPETKWWYNNGWIANTVHFDRAKMAELRASGFEGNEYVESLIGYDGFEFQFDKKIWQLSNTMTRLEIRSMVEHEGFEDLYFPHNSNRYDTTTWHRLYFGSSR